MSKKKYPIMRRPFRPGHAIYRSALEEHMWQCTGITTTTIYQIIKGLDLSSDSDVAKGQIKKEIVEYLNGLFPVVPDPHDRMASPQTLAKEDPRNRDDYIPFDYGRMLEMEKQEEPPEPEFTWQGWHLERKKNLLSDDKEFPKKLNRRFDRMLSGTEDKP